MLGVVGIKPQRKHDRTLKCMKNKFEQKVHSQVHRDIEPILK